MSVHGNKKGRRNVITVFRVLFPQPELNDFSEFGVRFHGVYVKYCVSLEPGGAVLPVKGLHNVFVGKVAQKDKRGHCRTSPIPSCCSAQPADGQRLLMLSRHWIFSVLSFTRAAPAALNQNLEISFLLNLFVRTQCTGCFVPVIRQSFNTKRKHCWKIMWLVVNMEPWRHSKQNVSSLKNMSVLALFKFAQLN